MRIEIKDLKNTISKINLAIEKNKINPQAGWIEIKTVSDSKIVFKVSNYDYYLQASVNAICDSDYKELHVTINSDTFIPLISKLDCDFIEINEGFNSLIISTDTNSYTFPTIKEYGVTKKLNTIDFTDSVYAEEMLGSDISTIASINAKGLTDVIYSKEIQKFVFMDKEGAITFTENIYINNFSKEYDTIIPILLNITQAKLLTIFEDIDKVTVDIETQKSFSANRKVKFKSNNIELICVIPSQELTEKFPSIKLREIANKIRDTHIIIDKKQLDKALSRLMVFDKKFDITECFYSKILFEENQMKLISIKNNNYEIIPYISSTNSFKHESIIRFADLVKQLKPRTTKTIDISYGQSSAIMVNSSFSQLIPEINPVLEDCLWLVII